MLEASVKAYYYYVYQLAWKDYPHRTYTIIADAKQFGIMTHSQPIVQYGFRDDDDDDDDDSDDERRQGFFGGVLQRQRNGSANKMPVGLDVISKLGASLSNSINFDFDNNNKGGDDDDHNYNSNHDDGDSDDGSVSSKASVASIASRQLKKLGGHLGFKKKNRRASDSESHVEDSSDDEDDGGMEASC